MIIGYLDLPNYFFLIKTPTWFKQILLNINNYAQKKLCNLNKKNLLEIILPKLLQWLFTWHSSDFSNHKSIFLIFLLNY